MENNQQLYFQCRDVFHCVKHTTVRIAFFLLNMHVLDLNVIHRMENNQLNFRCRDVFHCVKHTTVRIAFFPLNMHVLDLNVNHKMGSTELSCQNMDELEPIVQLSAAFLVPLSSFGECSRKS